MNRSLRALGWDRGAKPGWSGTAPLWPPPSPRRNRPGRALAAGPRRNRPGRGGTAALRL